MEVGRRIEKTLFVKGLLISSDFGQNGFLRVFSFNPGHSSETELNVLYLHCEESPVQPNNPDIVDRTDWDKIAAAPEFKHLMSAKKLFIVPAFIFFVVYYFLLPILVGYAPKFMATRIIGVINIAYLFALSQFLMAWGIAALYVRAANTFDKLAKDIIDATKDRASGAVEGR